MKDLKFIYLNPVVLETQSREMKYKNDTSKKFTHKQQDFMFRL